MIADLDNIIRDFVEQLRRATADGWYRTRPEHYRALVAALESALRERHERRHGRRSEDAVEGHAEARPHPDADLVSLATRPPWVFAPALMPVSRRPC
jgi:hypothetical protein